MSPENAGCLAAAGVDCCVLGNNHMLDWGRAGLCDTLATLDAARYLSAVRGKKTSSNMIVSPFRWKRDHADNFPSGGYVDRWSSPPSTPNDRTADCTEVLTSWRNHIAGPTSGLGESHTLFSMDRMGPPAGVTTT
jgi:hypothetical protein